MAAAAELDEKQRLVLLAGMNSSCTSPLITTTPQTKLTEHYEVFGTVGPAAYITCGSEVARHSARVHTNCISIGFLHPSEMLRGRTAALQHRDRVRRSMFYFPDRISERPAAVCASAALLVAPSSL